MRFTTRFLDMASKKRIILLAFLAVLIVVALAYGYRDGHWFGAEPEQPNALTLSGNIEAHESVLSFVRGAEPANPAEFGSVTHCCAS